MLHVSKYREQVFRPSCSHGLLLLSLSTLCLRVVLALSSCRRVVQLVRAFRRNPPASRFVRTSPQTGVLVVPTVFPHLLSSPPTTAEHLFMKGSHRQNCVLAIWHFQLHSPDSHITVTRAVSVSHSDLSGSTTGTYNTSQIVASTQVCSVQSVGTSTDFLPIGRLQWSLG